ncbi:MAG TPA: hypothetical protein VGP93_10225 [Polyangiaceae bacterium]|jgi:hypothetical protein|nr:hypothetical protein [Polyangiaceae bacterium]
MKVRPAGLMALCILSGCYGGGGSDDGGAGNGSGGAATQGLACAEDEFAIDGTLNGNTVSHRGTLDGHAWIQSTTSKTLDAIFTGGGDVHTEWAEVVADGETIAVTGSITLPPTGPNGGETLTAASGSMTKLAEEVDFELSGLSTSVPCDMAPCPQTSVDGSLTGCVHWKKIGP